MLQLILWNDEMNSEMKDEKKIPSLNICQAKSERIFLHFTMYV